jgi:hypothetical protein
MNTVIYIITCLIISIPFLSNLVNIIYSQPYPGGADATVHAFIIMKIVETHNPLVVYTQFPSLVENNGNMFYPSFMHLLIAVPLIIFNLDSPLEIISAVSIFNVLVAFSGCIGFSLLIREILKISILETCTTDLKNKGLRFSIYFNLLSILAFGFLISSTFLLLKTVNDGTYSQVFTMWGIFPFYLIFLLRRKWIVSAILLSVIAASHNLALLMTLSVTIAYILSMFVRRDKASIKKLPILVIAFGVLFIPSFILFYMPVVQSVSEGSSGNLEIIPNDIVISFLTPLLYYGVITASVILLILNYKYFSFFSFWMLIYFYFIYLIPILSSRVLRESSIAFSLILGISIAYSIHKILYSKRFRKLLNKRNTLFRKNINFVVLLIIVITVIPICFLNQYDRILMESNPVLSFFYSEAIGDSYKYLLDAEIEENHTQNNSKKENIAVFGYSPWLKTLLYDEFNIYEILPPDIGKQLSLNDKRINDDLLKILKNPSSRESLCMIKKYDIDIIYVSDDLPNRWYPPDKSYVYYPQLEIFDYFFDSPFIHLIESFNGIEGEEIRIYEVDKQSSNHC